MSLIQSGKIFNDGEQLTAGKLNQIISDATLSTTGVDGSTIVVNENDVLAVRTGGIGSSSLANDSVITNKLPNSTVTAVDGTPDGVTLPKLQHIETDKILGRTTTGNGVVEAVALNTDNAMANASATSLATDGSIKAYVDASRSKYVALTGGTTSLTKSNQSDGTIVTYNIADFTSSDSDFATSKIQTLIVEGFVATASGNTNKVEAILPDGTYTTVSGALANLFVANNYATSSIPINSGQTEFSIKFTVGNTSQSTYVRSTIKGAMI